MWHSFTEYLRLIRFSHTLFALPFALLGAAMAITANLHEQPPIYPRGVDFLGILLCMVFARSTAMAFNRLADRKYDARNPRTVGRHLSSGKMSVAGVTMFTALCAVGFVASTLLFLPNIIPLVFSVPVLFVLCGYSLAKRFTVFAHLWLGLSLGLSPLAAWLVFRPELWPLPYPPVLLGVAVMFWSAGFDIIYAFQDREHDFQEKLYSIPSALGPWIAYRVIVFFHALMLICLFCIPSIFPYFGKIWYLGICGVFLLLLGEHYTVVSPGIRQNPFFYLERRYYQETTWDGGPEIDAQRLNIAFFHLNAIISVALLLVGLFDLYF